MDENLDIIDENLRKADFIATGMSTWGFFKNLFKKGPKSKKQLPNVIKEETKSSDE